MARQRHFGEVPGVRPGAILSDRRLLAAAGVHRPLVAGISGSGSEGSDSIVLNGGYEDDEDYGDVIIYTGHGGNDPDTGRQVADQELKVGNLALALNCDQGLPVRVVRGWREPSKYAPSSGYRYDGLYRVESYWSERGRSGFNVWRYRLVRMEERTAEDAAESARPAEPAPRREATTQRIVRNTAQSQRVREFHGYRCQICGVRLETLAGPYAEGAHIRPLGRPHDGPDEASNILCLCPNHHVLFDAGAIIVGDDFSVVDCLSGARRGQLRRVPGHLVAPEHLAYHRRIHNLP